MDLLNILLMAPTQGEEGGGYTQFIFLGVVIVVFYFFFIRPQSKKAKNERKFREELKKGDKVVTTGGIHGKIHEINETTIVLEIEGQNRLKVEKSSIQMNATPAK